VQPWHRNGTRALRKEPKYYLWDWSQVSDPGARGENLIASALLKSVHWWTETGRGDFGLHFVRDKQKREVDCAGPGHFGKLCPPDQAASSIPPRHSVGVRPSSPQFGRR